MLVDVGIFLDAKTFRQSRSTIVCFEEEPNKLGLLSPCFSSFHTKNNNNNNKNQTVFDPVAVFPHYILAVGDQGISVIRITDGVIIQRLDISPFVDISGTFKKAPKTTSADSGYMGLQGQFFLLTTKGFFDSACMKYSLVSPNLEGNMVKIWKRRWFVLNGGVLFYFADEKVGLFVVFACSFEQRLMKLHFYRATRFWGPSC